MKLKYIFLSMFFLVLLSACASAKKEVEIIPAKTQFSSSLSFKPETGAQKSVYAQVTNSSTQPDFEIEEQLRTALKDRGYRLVKTADKASYTLRVNILQIAQNDEAEAKENLLADYGQPIFNVQNTLTAEKKSSYFSNMFKGKTTYQVIADIQISERDRAPNKTSTHPKPLGKNHLTALAPKHAQNDSSDVSAYMNISHWTQHQSRLLFEANRLSGDFEK